MGRLYELAVNEVSLYHDEVISNLEKMIYYEKIGDLSAFENAKKKITELNSVIKDYENNIYNPEKQQTTPYNFSHEREQIIFCENNDIILVPLSEKYKDRYIKLKREESFFNPKYYDDENNVVKAWKLMQNPYELNMAIIKKNSGDFMGCISINNTRCRIWEMSIELLRQFRGMRYGTMSLILFLKKVRDFTHVKEYCAYVETDNIACQRLMRKVGGQLVGIYNAASLPAALAYKFEEKHIDEITDHMLELADELEIEPRKLLSHVLEYRLNVDKM